MTATTGPPELRSDDDGDRLRMTVRFRAANGAMVTVAVNVPDAVDETGRALEIAREAIAQLAAAQSDEVRSSPEHTVGPHECGACYWSWALPEGWSRSPQ